MMQLTLRAGQVLRVTGQKGDSVRFYGGVPFTKMEFNSAEPDTQTIGPFARDLSVTVEPLTGAPVVQSGDTLAQRIDTIQSHTIIANAIIEGKRAMALSDKFKTLATRINSVPKNLEARADALAARLDTIEQRGDKAFSGHETFLDGVETGVAAAEDALNQLTNGAPASDPTV